MDKLANAVLAAIRTEHLIEPGTKLVLGLSGGADSVCLLHLMAGLRRLLKLSGLLAVHVNHGLRGAESERDEAFCERLCAAENVPFRAVRVDVKAAVRAEGRSVEEAARDLRYAALWQAARAFGASSEGDALTGAEGAMRSSAPAPLRVAVAHHADDQAETILLNLLRGSGLKGLSGMRPLRPLGEVSTGMQPLHVPGEEVSGAQVMQLPGSTQSSGEQCRVLLIRPLLSVERAEILRYLEERSLSYVTDSSNLSSEFARNRLRREILPVLAQLNGRAAGRIVAAGALCGEADAYLQAEASAFLDAVSAKPALLEAGGVCFSIPRKALKEKARIFRGYVIMEVLRRLRVPLKDWGERQIAAIDQALFAGGAYHLDLPGGVKLDNRGPETCLSQAESG